MPGTCTLRVLGILSLQTKCKGNTRKYEVCGHILGTVDDNPDPIGEGPSMEYLTMHYSTGGTSTRT